MFLVVVINQQKKLGGPPTSGMSGAPPWQQQQPQGPPPQMQGSQLQQLQEQLEAQRKNSQEQIKQSEINLSAQYQSLIQQQQVFLLKLLCSYSFCCEEWIDLLSWAYVKEFMIHPDWCEFFLVFSSKLMRPFMSLRVFDWRLWAMTVASALKNWMLSLGPSLNHVPRMPFR